MRGMLTRRSLLGTLGLGSIVGTIGWAAFRPAKANAYYQGPVSDHFDGLRFFNPGGPNVGHFGKVLRMWATERYAAWPEAYPSPFRDVPPPRVDGSALRVTLIGHASFLIQTGGANLLLDPVWAERASPFRFFGPRRANPPGVAFDDLPPIDAILVTHNHYDHLDVDVLSRLWHRDRPLIVTPLGNDTIIRAADPAIDVVSADWGGRIELPRGIIAHVVPTQHWSARSTSDRRHALWASFVITTPAGTIYAVGDTGFGDGRTFRHVRQHHAPIRLALLPIGAYEPRWFMQDQHINPDEAVEAFVLCGAQRAVGHHWGTFQLTSEPIDQPPADLGAALARKGIAAERFRALRPGEVCLLDGSEMG